MRRHILRKTFRPFPLAAVLLAACLGSSAALAGATKPPVPLLWKVSDADNAIYLLGSFHLLKQDDYPLSADVDAAFADAERVVFEVPPEQMTDPAVAVQMMQAAGFDDGRTLSQVLPVKLRKSLAGVLAGSGGSVQQLDGFEPWFVNLSLVMGVSHSMGFSADSGLDRHLMQRASEEGKPTSGLEGVSDQIRVLDSTPLDEQIAGLAEFVDNPADMQASLTELHRAWRSADVARLDALTRGEMKDKTPVTYRLVNVERNKAWLPKLGRMLDDPGTDDSLVVVGALHLLGDDGVVSMLRSRGYKVERICSSCRASLEP